jgi:hypothetical protein
MDTENKVPYKALACLLKEGIKRSAVINNLQALVPPSLIMVNIAWVPALALALDHSKKSPRNHTENVNCHLDCLAKSFA